MTPLKLQSGPILYFPSTWEEVTLGQHIEARKHLELKAPHSTHLQGILSALSRHPLPTIRKMTPLEVDKAVEVIAFYTHTSPPSTPVEKFTHDGVTYQVPTDLSTRTFGEFVDFDTAITNHLSNLEPGSSQLVILEALLTYCRPEGESHADTAGETDEAKKLREKRKKSFLNLPMTTVEGVAGFFLESGPRLDRTTQLYGAARIQAVTAVLHMHDSARSTAGWLSLRTWLKMILKKRLLSRIEAVHQSLVGSGC